METEFNLQDFLRDMRKEQKEAHTELRDEVRDVLAKHASKLTNHDNRLQAAETSLQFGRKIGWGVLLGFIAGVIDVVTNHLPKLFAQILR